MQPGTPDHLEGRVTAIHRFLVCGAAALGALLGGVLGMVFDLRLAILRCAVGGLAAGSALRAHRG
jgi:hypothetical protein